MLLGSHTFLAVSVKTIEIAIEISRSFVLLHACTFSQDCLLEPFSGEVQCATRTASVRLSQSAKFYWRIEPFFLIPSQWNSRARGSEISHRSSFRWRRQQHRGLRTRFTSFSWSLHLSFEPYGSIVELWELNTLRLVSWRIGLFSSDRVLRGTETTPAMFVQRPIRHVRNLSMQTVGVDPLIYLHNFICSPPDTHKHLNPHKHTPP